MDLIDSKYKEERVRKFVNQIKKSSNITPFLYLEDIFKYGIKDFYHITKCNITIQIVEQKLPTYKILDDFIRDITSVFNAVSTYVFLDDPIQQICGYYIEKINLFAQQFKKDAQLQKQSKMKIIQSKKIKESKQSKQSKQQHELKQLKQQADLRQKQERFYLEISTKLDILCSLRKEVNNFKLFRQMQQYSKFCTNQSNTYIVQINPLDPFWQANLPKKYNP